MDRNSIIIAIGILALVFLIWNFTISVRIMNYLKAHGEKVNPATMHFKIFDNARKYRQVTLKETGKVGPLYNPFITSFVIFAIILMSGIILVST